MKLVILWLRANGKYGNECSVTMIILTPMFKTLKLHKKKNQHIRCVGISYFFTSIFESNYYPFLCIGPG